MASLTACNELKVTLLLSHSNLLGAMNGGVFPQRDILSLSAFHVFICACLILDKSVLFAK